MPDNSGKGDSTPRQGDDLMIQGEAAPDEGGQAGGGAAVADVTLDRCNGAVAGLVAGKETGQGLCFHPVFGRIAAAAGFQEADAVRLHTGTGIGPFHGFGIGLFPWVDDAPPGGADALMTA